MKDSELIVTEPELLSEEEDPTTKAPEEMTEKELEEDYWTSTKPPADAVEYHGYCLGPQELERFKDVEAFHMVWGKKKHYGPNWREKYGEKDPEAIW